MTFIQVLKIFFRYVLKYKVLYGVFILAMLFTAMVNNLLPVAFKEFVETLQKGDIEGIYQPFILIALVFVGDTIFSVITFYALARLYNRVSADLKEDVIAHLQEQDYDFHTSKSSGKLIATVNRGDNAVFNLLFIMNNRLMLHCLNIALPIIFIFFYSWEVSLLIIIFLGLFAGLVTYLLKRNITYRKAIFEPEGEVTAVVVDNLSNFETVKAFAREVSERKRLRLKLGLYMRAQLNYMDSFRALDISISALAFIILTSGIFFSIRAYQAGTMSLATVVFIATYLFAYPNKLFDFFYSFRDIAKSHTDIASFLELTELKPKVVDSKDPISIQNPKGHIKFRQVGFSYKDTKTLEAISMDIQPGEKIALVGPSGAGKSTITKLLLRYYDIQEGTIYIDGVDIKKLSQKSLREIMGIVPQDPIMFNNTISFNVGYAIDSPSEEQVIQACKQAQIHDFIMTLPEKYETVVGERGIKLSGGQRQRLAIARMILKNPKVLLFDEATSALDSESESAIHKAFTEVSKHKTMIVIAHRLSTIVNCDKIYVIDGGRVVQQGTHQSLVLENGMYKNLWNIQSRGFENVD